MNRRDILLAVSSASLMPAVASLASAGDGGIASMTKDCPRQDCRISYSGGRSTLMSWQPTYDRDGSRTDKGDPNITTSEASCASCGKQWVLKSQYGETKVTLVEPPAAD